MCKTEEELYEQVINMAKEHVVQAERDNNLFLLIRFKTDLFNLELQYKAYMNATQRRTTQ